MPTPMTTTGNTMYVKFRSDQSVATPGFRATWTVGRFTTLQSLYKMIHYKMVFDMR